VRDRVARHVRLNTIVQCAMSRFGCIMRNSVALLRFRWPRERRRNSHRPAASNEKSEAVANHASQARKQPLFSFSSGFDHGGSIFDEHNSHKLSLQSWTLATEAATATTAAEAVSP